MSSKTPPQDPGGFKGFFKNMGAKFKKGRRAKGKDSGSRAHLSVPAAGEGYESSAYSKEQSRSATPVLNEPNRPATPGTAHSALGSVQQTAPHTPLIKDLPTMSTRNELGLEPDANTFGPIVMPSTFEQLPASTGGDKAYAAGVTDDGNTGPVLPSKEEDLESSTPSVIGPTEIRAPFASLAADKLLPSDTQIANLPVVDLSMASSASDDNAKSASGTFPPTSAQAPKRTARVWFDAATGLGKTLLKKLPDVVDTNPVKVVAAIVKVAIEAAEIVGDNKDNLTRLSTKLESLAHLEAIEDGIPTDAEAIHKSLKQALSNASATISNLTSQSRVLQTISYEQYSKEIQGVFDDIDDAVQTFQVQIAGNIDAKAEKILDMARDEKLYRLNPSPGAHYDSDVEGQRIRREECTKGTRVAILNNITTWARDDSPQSPLVYWLTGQAGSGKTTIATSIAAEFSGATEGITLGADFFCSRNSPESNTTRRIVPTIAYQLARKCPPYGAALIVPGKLDKLDAVYSPVPKQLQSLFLTPWLQCEARRAQSRYLIVIDALDELKENGSAEFLDAVFTLFEALPVNGVKIFITSRPEDRIATRVELFHSRAIARLQEVPLEDVSPDIRKYLESELPTLGSNNLDKLTDLAAGLFIYAATAVRCIKPRDDTSSDDQDYLLEEFLKYTRNAGLSRPDFIVDELYQQIMGAALHPYMQTPKLLAAHLSAIHLALSTGERASAATIAALFNKNTEGKGYKLTEKTVMSVVQTGLHAVLYVKDGLIFWYHASFPDFIFDSSRSNFIFTAQDGKTRECQFTCNEEGQHTWLRDLCFDRLKELRFNISSIPSSFDLDQNHTYNPNTLLLYSAVNWSHHLPITGDAGASDIGEFLVLRTLFWIEFMHIIKRLDDCVSILQRAQRWIRQHIDVDTVALDERLSEVIAFVKDFLQVFPSVEDDSDWDSERNIELLTPHLYISHLAAWSGGPKTVQRWKENFRNLPHITHSHKDIPLIFTADGQKLVKDERHVPPGAKFEDGRVTSVAFLNKGTQILSGYNDGSVTIWDASTGVLQVHLEVSEQQLPMLTDATTPAGFDDCVCVWNRIEEDTVYSDDNMLNEGFWSIAASADSTRIRSESINGRVYIWDLVSGKWQLVSQFESSVQGSVSPNGAYLINVTDNSQINIHKITPTGLQIICPPLKDASSVTICRHGTKLHVLYGCGQNELVYLKCLDDKNTEQNVLQEHIMSTLPQSWRGHWIPATISSDQSTIVAASTYNARLLIWSPVTGNQQLLPYHPTRWQVSSLAISEDNKHILSCNPYSIRLWDISGDTKLALLKEHTNPDREFQNWGLQEDGWVVSSQAKVRLMWVPTSFREAERFAVPEMILFISEMGYYSVDFSKAKFGKDWAECYTPTTSAGPT